MTGTGTRTPPALRVDIELDRGSYAFETTSRITGVFGRSGAGKTTLLHALAGLLPARGHIELHGVALLDSAQGINLAPETRRVGIVFQDDRLFPHRTVRRNLQYGQDRAGGAGASLEDIAARLDLTSLLDRMPGTLSGGERRRTAIARAVLARPRLLLLDEPLASLDTRQCEHVLQLLERLDATVAPPMLHVAHDPAELVRRADTMLVIEDGRAVGHGTLETLAAHTEAWSVLRQLGAVNAVRARVLKHDVTAGLTRYAIRNGNDAATVELAGPIERTGASDEDDRILIIGTRDIALSRERLRGVSIRNQLAGRVVRLVRHSDHTVIEVDIGVSVLVEVSHQTVDSMALETGLDVVCLVKSNSVREGGRGERGRGKG